MKTIIQVSKSSRSTTAKEKRHDLVKSQIQLVEAKLAIGFDFPKYIAAINEAILIGKAEIKKLEGA